MSSQTHPERRFAGVDQLSLRGLILGALGSAVITASSIYVALRMSALPWPTIFVAVLSMALLKGLGRTTHNEINITQTAMSAGAMVAGGLAFTLPGLWIAGLWQGPALTPAHFGQVLAVALAGMLLGTVLGWLLRPRFIDQADLPYPLGAAAAETIKIGDQGGRKAGLLFGTMGLSALFTYFRDALGWFPAALVSKGLYARNVMVGLWVAPMAAAIGYLIGPLFTGVWFLGAVLSYLLIIPLGPALKLFPAVEAAVAFKNTAGIGLMVGTGLGILIAYLLSLFNGNSRNGTAASTLAPAKTAAAGHSHRFWILLAVSAAFVLSLLAGLDPIPSLLLMAGVLAACAMAAIITGESGINPMEIFGIIVLLGIRLVVPIGAAAAFFVAAATAVACGYTGDLFFDYKAGKILGTNPAAQIIAQIVGGVTGCVVATLALFAVIGQFGGVGTQFGLPAGQAFAVSQMVNGVGDPIVFGIAAAIGIALYLAKVPAMTLGIGMYLPFEISSVVFLGGLIRWIMDKVRPRSGETGNIAASGLLGGEGITGVGIAIVKMITGA